MPENKSNKTEYPTPRKLTKAREKGQVARSKEVPSAAVLLGMLVFLYYAGQKFYMVLESEMRMQFQLHVPSEFTVSYISGLVNGISTRLVGILGTALLTALTLSLAANVVQGGFLISWEPLGFNVGKLNPKNGMARIFSKYGLVEFCKSLLLLSVVSIITYNVVTKHISLFPQLVLMNTGQLFYWITSISFDVFLRVAIFLVVVAIADYAFQKHRFIEQLKMTKQEVRDELKDTEGDPITRGRIRRVQREMARKRMMADVAKADVVITNPTHFAVALSYDMETMDAPRVVAKGVGFLALKIKELAQSHNIPIVENRPLAQTLYKTVEIGQTIPTTLYRAVAEILAYIYKARNAWKR
jgi:flagellar biosynthesis protein FlhB